MIQAQDQQSLDSRELDELVAILGDRWERMNRLYLIQDEKGHTLRFRPNLVQTYLEDHLWWLNLILKSRQHGITTWACIRALDKALWSPGSRCGIIAHRKEDAEKFFRQKVLFAYDRLDPAIQAMVPVTRRDMGGVLEFANGSSIEVSVSHRGGTFQYMHISEYGPMCAMFPQRAAEVRSGALNTVHDGAIVTIESTAYGREGDFFERTKKAEVLEQLVESGQTVLTRMDYRFFFFPWFDDVRNKLHERVYITDEQAEYFARIEAETGATLTDPQKWWYVKKSEDQGDKMMQEHPSTPDEAFTVGQQAYYYAKALATARHDGRITRIPIEPSIPVNTFWDLGRNDMNAIWLHQRVALENRFIAYYENAGEAIHHYAGWLREFREKHGIVYGTHYLPHDAEVVEFTREDGKTREEVLNDLGVEPTIIVPRIENLGEGIDMVRRSFPSYWFDAERCKKGLERLAQYQKRYNATIQAYQDDPAKNDARNGADALRQHAQGYVPGAKRLPGKKRERNWRTV